MKQYDPKKFNTMPERQRKWDYRRRGYYFVTLITKNKIHCFGKIENAKPTLSEIGKIDKKNWLAIPTPFPDVVSDKYVIMPNHIHGIIGIQKTSTGIRDIPRDGWSRGFHDYIIYKVEAMDGVVRYIEINPLKWEEKRKKS